MIDWIGSLSNLVLADQSEGNIFDLGVGEVWYSFGQGGQTRHCREGLEPPFRFQVQRAEDDPSQLQERFWACCEAAQRDLWKDGEDRPYTTPIGTLDALQKLLGDKRDKPLNALALSADTIRKFFADPFYKDWNRKKTIRPPKTWRPFHERLQQLHVHVLDSNGPLGEVFGFTHQELVGRINYSWLRGRMGVAIMVGGVAKVTITEDGKPIDWDALFAEEGEEDETKPCLCGPHGRSGSLPCPRHPNR